MAVGRGALTLACGAQRLPVAQSQVLAAIGKPPSCHGGVLQAAAGAQQGEDQVALHIGQVKGERIDVHEALEAGLAVRRVKPSAVSFLAVACFRTRMRQCSIWHQGTAIVPVTIVATLLSLGGPCAQVD